MVKMCMNVLQVLTAWLSLTLRAGTARKIILARPLLLESEMLLSIMLGNSLRLTNFCLHLYLLEMGILVEGRQDFGALVSSRIKLEIYAGEVYYHSVKILVVR